MTTEHWLAIGKIAVELIALLGGIAVLIMRMEARQGALGNSIEHLAKSVDRLRRMMFRLEKRQQDHEVRISVLEKRKAVRGECDH